MVSTLTLRVALISSCIIASVLQPGAAFANTKPKVTAFEILWRKQAEKEGRFTSANITFQTIVPLRVGAIMTVIPLAPGLRPVEARISSVKRQPGCTGQNKVYTVKISGLRDRSLLTVPPLKGRRGETPIDVAVLHPAVKRARFIPLTVAVRAMLPSKLFKVRRLGRAYAIDLNGSSRPDLVFVEDNFKDDYTRSKIWWRSRAGWRVLDKSMPC